MEIGIGNGWVENINQKIKETIASGYSFRNTDNLIAMVTLRCSDEHPALPWEDRKEKPQRAKSPKRTLGHENYQRLLKGVLAKR